MNPFLALTSEKILADELVKVFPQIPEEEIREACHSGWEEMAAMRRDIEAKGEETLKWMEETGHRGIVLAGRPYHIDPEIHHGIPDMINSYDIAVLTEDSVSHLAPLERPLRVNDQWMYHHPSVRRRQLCKNQGGSGSDPAELLRLRSGRCHHRPGIRDPHRQRQDLHLPENR